MAPSAVFGRTPARSAVGAAGLLLTVLLSPASATAAVVRSHGRRADVEHSNLRRGAQSRGGPDTQALVASIRDVVSKLEKENDAVKKLAEAREKECEKQLGNYSDTNKAIRAGQELIQKATIDLKEVRAIADAVGVQMDTLKGDIESAQLKIVDLTKQLKTLRDNHKKEEKSAVATLQELDSVVSQAQWQEEHQRHRSAESAKQMNSEVSDLRRLGRQLSASADSAVSFVQTKAERASSDGSDVASLQADRRQLIHARKAANKGFQEEETRLIELIKTTREEMTKLQHELAEARPTLAAKLKQAAETNKTISMTVRVLARDQATLHLIKGTCLLRSSRIAAQITARDKIISLLKMPAVILEKMDLAMFLERDLRELVADAPSFVQLGETKLALAVQEALTAADQANDAVTAATAGMGGGDEVGAPAAGASGNSLLQQGVTNGVAAGGPFDKVVGMIKELISNMRDSANEDMDLNQWCTEVTNENDKDTFKAESTANVASSQILWAQSAMQRLGEEVAFLEGEIPRLQQESKEVSKDFQKDIDTVTKELSDQNAHRETLGKVMKVLQDTCKVTVPKDQLAALGMLQMSGVGEAFVGHRANHKRHAWSLQQLATKNGQCQEAASILGEVGLEMQALHRALGSYLTDLKTQRNQLVSSLATTQRQRERDLTTAKAAKGDRANDLALAEGDKKQSEKNLALAEEAKQAIEKKCSVKETKEERMAKRQDEIDALRSALKVLNGEEIPVAA